MHKNAETIFAQDEKKVSITCFGRSPKVLKELLDECRRQYLEVVRNKTTVFEHRGDRWKPTKARDIRDMSTVVLDEEKKERLLKDVENFLDPRARAWYSKRGIPYTRGYLLYGPPGTGKSSLGLSVAGCFGLDVYVLSLPSLDDKHLSALLAKLPQSCVVLMEDIDAVGTTQSRDTEIERPNQAIIDSTSTRSKLSLSGLLNALDGAASQEGRVLIMTTNHIKRLDKAVIRPGRVDRKVEFQLAEKTIIARLFGIVFMSDDDTPNPEKRVEDDK
ncbi:hypothetical protein DL766_005967 [Monosporascus sp. MC13-8B]|uniref:AAA+ ATPase domain-containing protein n=1 Tax=Monosporascus cannonballus TaxID=155416 RepID=A0ABY0HB87_9PEZI|nr:hypothetical protein DL762_004761 [Monosporascus cannonballus]RYO95713.1 hypothetical protein DL763_003604 [Monosporascus cannonballus]RYP28261.1 hypothetical protein DL766_005967 [Monosporascus sp. MC13-8B]